MGLLFIVRLLSNRKVTVGNFQRADVEEKFEEGEKWLCFLLCGYSQIARLLFHPAFFVIYLTNTVGNCLIPDKESRMKQRGTHCGIKCSNQ